MDQEIHNFIKIWIATILCSCYCYYVASRIPKGFARLLSLIPIVHLFITLPANLSSFHLGGPMIFFLVWLGTFKLLLFAFDQGPLSPLPPTLAQFLAIASFPIKIKQTPPSKHDQPQTLGNQKLRKSIKLATELLLLATIIHLYGYRENLHPYVILCLYCCHMYLGLEIVLATAAAPLAICGFEMEASSNAPYLSTSLQDFWGRRWNLMVTGILRPTVYNPTKRLSGSIIGFGPRLSSLVAVMATFTVSGLMHEVIYYYLERVPPTWEVTWFFVLHGLCVGIEIVSKPVLLSRGWRLPPVVSGFLTLSFLAVTGEWLFFPQLLRNGVDRRAIGEYSKMVDFVKSKLQFLT